MTEENTTTHKNWFARHKILTVLLALILIGIIGSAMGGGKKNTASKSSASTTSTASTKKEDTAKIGTAVRDGKFEFVVKSVECNKPNVGTNQYLTKTAQGQYCLLNVSVKNIGDKAQTLFSANQKLQNAAGQEFSADDQATMYAAPDASSTWYSNINPGNSVEGVIVFDLPQGQTPTQAELHDSAASGGVKVSLQ